MGGGHHITAVEYNSDIAAVYHDMYPNDTIIVGDAHEYLINHFKEYDIIWASPPCPTHSDIRRCGVHSQVDAVYPEMSLYQEIILLQNFFKGKFIVENVKPYYPPLIKPSIILERHLWWTNFDVRHQAFKDDRVHNDIKASSTVYGVNLDKYKINDKRKILRNMVNPELGLYFLDLAIISLNKKYKSKIVEASLF